MVNIINHQRQSGGIQVGFLVGLFAGIVITGILVVSFTSFTTPRADVTATSATPPLSPPISAQVTPAPSVPQVAVPPLPEVAPTEAQPSVAEGIPGVDVITPTPGPAEPAVPSPQGMTGSFYLQVGAYRIVEQAERFKDRLTNLGFTTVIQTSDLEGAPIYRVRIGPLSTRAEVDDMRQRLAEQEIEASLVRLN